MLPERGAFGGFCNYGVFWVEGKDAETGKKKLRKLYAVSEAAAARGAVAAGCVAPFTMRAERLGPPTEKQLDYLRDLGVEVPEDCTQVDASALIRRAESANAEDPTPGLLAYADDCWVCFSRLSCEAELLERMVAQLFQRERSILFAHAVCVHVNGARLGDPRADERFPAVEQFAGEAAEDPALWKSIEQRPAWEYLTPGHNTKAYKAALRCL